MNLLLFVVRTLYCVSLNIHNYWDNLMRHDLKSNSEYALINIQLAITETDVNVIADALNDFLREEIGEGFIADYIFNNSDTPNVVMTSDEPAEGELFEAMNQYIVNVTSGHDTERAQIDTVMKLVDLDNSKLLEVLQQVMKIGPDDTVEIFNLADVNRVNLKL